jgi:hypothetical protein
VTTEKVIVKIITWNIARRKEAWRHLLDVDADVALFQEAAEPPADVARRLEVDPAPWRTGGEAMNRRWRAAVVRLSDRVELRRLEPKPLDEALPHDLAVSRIGTLAAATVVSPALDPLTVVSIYAPWEKTHTSLGSSWTYADGSVHRIISDLSVLIGREVGHRLIVAGDLNILFGYGEHGSEYWASRYATVFTRMAALGFALVGPQAPAGRVAHPWPGELPQTSNNVPTYHTNRQTPITATRQLDFVFASVGLHERVRAKAINAPECWGPSDHCRIEIEVT